MPYLIGAASSPFCLSDCGSLQLGLGQLSDQQRIISLLSVVVHWSLVLGLDLDLCLVLRILQLLIISWSKSLLDLILQELLHVLALEWRSDSATELLAFGAVGPIITLFSLFGMHTLFGLLVPLTTMLCNLHLHLKLTCLSFAWWTHGCEGLTIDNWHCGLDVLHLNLELLLQLDLVLDSV